MKITLILSLILLLGIYSLGTKADYSLEYKGYPDKQLILFHGKFGDAPFDKAENFLKQLQKNKPVHLYIGRGYGGSVKEHKRFVRLIREKCPTKSCELVTYLDGQCSSMCTTLFLSGDKRYARDDSFANLAFHRTLIRFAGRRIPIQSVNGMVRYFTKFDGVNERYIKKHKNRFFKRPGNSLYNCYGQELLDAGFADELIPELNGDSTSFLSLFPSL